MTRRNPLPPPYRKWSVFALVGIMQVLSLFVVGCSGTAGSAQGPAVAVTERGNEVVRTIPQGTSLFFKDEAEAIKFSALFFNETERKSNMVVLKMDLVIVTLAYLSGRDADEEELFQKIAEQKIRGNSP
jgi:hypothetical protein